MKGNERERRDVWLRRTHDEYVKFLVEVREEFSQSVWEFLMGEYPANAKPLKGLGSGVHEIVVEEGGDTFRVVVTVSFAKAIYVLHVFKKKSKQGVRTPLQDIRLIRQRLRDAEAHYRTHYT